MPKSDDEKHEETVAAILAAGAIQKQNISPKGGAQLAADVVTLHRQILAQLRQSSP
jgi:hypothetical protein